MLLHQLEDGLRILQRHVTFRDADRCAASGRPGGDRLGRGGVIGLVTPGRDVVLAGRWVIAGEETVLEPVILLHQERRIRVVAHILLVEEGVL